MQYYQNKSGKSNIVAFEIGVDYITIMFRGNSIYTYNYQSAGSEVIEHMKKTRLARLWTKLLCKQQQTTTFFTNHIKKHS